MIPSADALAYDGGRSASHHASKFTRATLCSESSHTCVQVELLSWRSIKDLSGDGGVIKTVLEEGKGWSKPADKDEALGEPPAACADWQP